MPPTTATQYSLFFFSRISPPIFKVRSLRLRFSLGVWSKSRVSFWTEKTTLSCHRIDNIHFRGATLYLLFSPLFIHQSTHSLLLFLQKTHHHAQKKEQAETYSFYLTSNHFAAISAILYSQHAALCWLDQSNSHFRFHFEIIISGALLQKLQTYQQRNGCLAPIELPLSVVQNVKGLQGCLVSFVHLVVMLNLPLVVDCSLRLLS